MVKIIICVLLATQLAYADAIRVPSDITILKRRSKKSKALLEVPAGAFVDVIAEKRGWVKVRVRNITGWIPEESIVELATDEAEAAPAPAPEPPVTVAVVEEAEPVDEVEQNAESVAEVPPRERRLDIAVTGGLGVITQGFRTTGGSGAVPDNYNIGVTAATIALSTRYKRRLSQQAVLAAELAYAYQRSVPGIRLADPLTGNVVTTGFSIHDVGAHVGAGYDLGRVVLYARAGVRWHLFEIEGVLDPSANPAKVPSEVRLSPTFGAAADLAITEKLGAAFTLDTLIGAQTKQTAGLRDGVKADAKGLAASATIAYRWRPTLDVRASYALEAIKVDFGAPDPQSMRMHAGSTSARFDSAHTMTIGLAKGF